MNNDDNRKDTQKLIDFLSSKELSTATPKVIVESFIIKDKEIDVLTIFDTKRLPVFLKSNYKKGQKSIYPGQIFTRIGDTNTPINTTANDPALEKLYRKRLRLDITIYERYDYLIERVNDWTYIDEEQKLLYNFDPNFYILIVPCDEEEENRLYHTGDYYSWLVDSSSFPSEWKINSHKSVIFMYGEHKIFEENSLLDFDRDRGITISPYVSYLDFPKKDLPYNYLIKDSRIWKFMKLFSSAWDNCMSEPFNSSYYSANSILENIVVYLDEEEKKDIEQYYYGISTILQLELDCGIIITPTIKEIQDLQKNNPNFTELSLIKNNIAKAITKKISDTREH